MNGKRVARRKRGSSLGEQVIMLVLAALFMAVIVAAFSYSPVHGYTVLSVAAACGRGPARDPV